MYEESSLQIMFVSFSSMYFSVIVLLICIVFWHVCDSYSHQLSRTIQPQRLWGRKRTSNCKITHKIRSVDQTKWLHFIKRVCFFPEVSLEIFIKFWRSLFSSGLCSGWWWKCSREKSSVTWMRNSLWREDTYAASPNFLVWEGRSSFLRSLNQVSICLWVLPQSSIKLTISLWNDISTGEKNRRYFRNLIKHFFFLRSSKHSWLHAEMNRRVTAAYLYMQSVRCWICLHHNGTDWL